MNSLCFVYLGDKDTKICGAMNVKCYVNAEDKLFGEDIIDGLTDRDAKSFQRKCDCLPACNKTQFAIQIDRAKLDLTKWVHSYDVELDRIEEYVNSGCLLQRNSPLMLHFDLIFISFCLVRFEYSSLIFSFDDSTAEIQKRTALFTSLDFLAACGGLMGLFLGISAFSLFKYIVNFTLCFFWMLREKRNNSNTVAPFRRESQINIHTIVDVDEISKRGRAQWKNNY